MTVGELIKLLERFEPSFPIYVYNCQRYRAIINVEFSTYCNEADGEAIVLEVEG